MSGGAPPEAEAALRQFDPAVSRETLAALAAYLEILTKWQKAINLVGPATLQDAWARHIVDSAQLLPLLPPDAKRLADLGTGAGFPGLVAHERDLVDSLRKHAGLGRGRDQHGLSESFDNHLNRSLL